MSDTEKMPGNHTCVFCNQIFCSKEELQVHFRRHANQEIDIKGKPRLIQKRTEQSRSSRMSGEKSSITTVHPKNTDNAICDVCGEHFGTVSLAISHKFRKHPESAVKHYCPHCGMMFPIKVNRDNHVLTHTSMAPKQVYPCISCGVSFYNFGARKFHMDSAHKGSYRVINPIDTPAPSLKIVLNNAGEAFSVYYCHLCGCEYQVKYNLQKHLETRHSELERTSLPEQVVQCNLCTALFYSKRAYEAHNHHHRASDLYATNEAMRQNIVQRIDQDFDQRRVPTTIERYLSASAVNSNRSATWRNIRATRRKEESLLSCSKQKPVENKELIVKINSKYVPLSTKKFRTQQHNAASLESDCSIIPTSNLNLGDEGMFDDDDNISKGVGTFIQGENMCWSGDNKSGRKKTMLNDSEEDDCEIRSLGLVNPDTIMSNPRLLCNNYVEDVSNMSSNNDIIGETLSKSSKESGVDEKEVASKSSKRNSVHKDDVLESNSGSNVNKKEVVSNCDKENSEDKKEIVLKSDQRNHLEKQVVVSKIDTGNYVQKEEVISKSSERDTIDKKEVLSQTHEGNSADDMKDSNVLKSVKRKSDECHKDDNGNENAELVVEKILGMRQNSGGREFLVRWKAFEPVDDSWEREEVLHCVELIVDFLKYKGCRKGRNEGDCSKAPLEWYTAPKTKKLKVKT